MKMPYGPDGGTINQMSETIEKIHKLCHLIEYGEEDMRHEYHSSNTSAKMEVET